MRNFFAAFIFLAIAAVLGYAAFQKVRSERSAGDSNASAQLFQFPDDIEIARKDGSRLMVRLTGRDASHIQFERLSDQMGFTFAIDDLDTPTQRLVRQYPESGPIPTEEAQSEAPTDIESIHVQQLREQIARIDSELRTLQIKYAATPSSAERRRMQQEVRELNAERLTIAAEIAQRTGVELERRRAAELRNKY